MEVKRIIIHELIKVAHESEVKHNLSSNLLKINDGITKLVDHIHNAFDQSITKYSKFDITKVNNAVYKNVDSYLNTDNDDKQFIKFSKASLGELIVLIEREPFATGGYYLFVDYLENGYNYIAIIIVRNKDAFNIEWNGRDFKVDETENVNIEKLAMGFRINCGLYLDNDDTRNYLALISHQGDDLSRYFTIWVNADHVIDSRTNTRQLIGVLKELGPPVGYANPDDFDRDIYDWIDGVRKANKNVVDIDTLSEVFYGSRMFIRDYAQQKLNKEIDPTFNVNGNELKKLIRYKATSKGLSISVDLERFINGDVQLDNGLVTIKDDKIYNELKNQRTERE